MHKKKNQSDLHEFLLTLAISINGWLDMDQNAQHLIDGVNENKSRLEETYQLLKQYHVNDEKLTEKIASCNTTITNHEGFRRKCDLAALQELDSKIPGLLALLEGRFDDYS